MKSSLFNQRGELSAKCFPFRDIEPPSALLPKDLIDFREVRGAETLRFHQNSQTEK
jgi:hypothetical protein